MAVSLNKKMARKFTFGNFCSTPSSHPFNQGKLFVVSKPVYDFHEPAAFRRLI